MNDLFHCFMEANYAVNELEMSILLEPFHCDYGGDFQASLELYELIVFASDDDENDVGAGERFFIVLWAPLFWIAPTKAQL